MVFRFSCTFCFLQNGDCKISTKLIKNNQIQQLSYYFFYKKNGMDRVLLTYPCRFYRMNAYPNVIRYLW
jgi:hypothetical protein